MATDKNRYTVSVDDDVFEKIEDFRFGKRFGTRSQATVELIKLGLAALERDGLIPVAAHNDKRTKEEVDIMKKDIEEL